MSLDDAGRKKDGDQTQAGQNLQAGSEQTSAAEQLTSKIDVEKQYSGTEVKELTKKLVEDALSADGREQKGRAEKAEAEAKLLTGQVSGLTTQFNTVSGQVTELLKAQDDAEAAKVQDDPAALSSLRARQANRAESLRLEGIRADYDAKNAKLTERLTEADKKEVNVSIKLAAMAAGVDEKKLADLVPDGDAGRLANAANLLKQSATPEIDPVTGKPKPAALTNKPASAISVGGESRSVSEKMLEDAKSK